MKNKINQLNNDWLDYTCSPYIGIVIAVSFLLLEFILAFFKTNLVNKWNFVGIENYIKVIRMRISMKV